MIGFNCRKVISRSLPGYPGVDIKGDGGMFVAPPSRRNDGVYKWLNNLPIADAPHWLLELVCDTEVRSDDDSNEALSDAEITAGCIAIRDHLPNHDLGWDEWNTIGMKIWFTVSDARGFDAFDGVSKRSSKYNERNTMKKWNTFPKITADPHHDRLIHLSGQRGHRSRMA